MPVIRTDAYSTQYTLRIAKSVLYFFVGITVFLMFASTVDVKGNTGLAEFAVPISVGCFILIYRGYANLRDSKKFKTPYNLVPHEFKFSSQIPLADVTIVVQWPREFDFLPAKGDAKPEPSEVPQRFKSDITNQLTKFFEYYNAMPQHPSAITTMQIEQALEAPMNDLVHSLELPQVKYDCISINMPRPMVLPPATPQKDSLEGYRKHVANTPIGIVSYAYKNQFNPAFNDFVFEDETDKALIKILRNNPKADLRTYQDILHIVILSIEKKESEPPDPFTIPVGDPT